MAAFRHLDRSLTKKNEILPACQTLISTCFAQVSQGAASSVIFPGAVFESTQARQEQDSQAPVLQGATNGTIGPQGSDATYITGVNTAGTVLASDSTIVKMVPFANAALCFAGLFIAIFTFANQRGCKWAQWRGFSRKEEKTAWIEKLKGICPQERGSSCR